MGGNFLRVLIIIVINAVLLLFIDMSFYYYYLKTSNSSYYSFIDRYTQKVKYFSDIYMRGDNFRDCIDLQTEKLPILIFGCSFAYGFLLEPEQSFAYKLSRYTNRKVYNRAISSGGIEDFLYILQHSDIEKKVVNPEYIIYVYIEDHCYRLYRQIMSVDEFFLNTVYFNHNNELKEKKYFCPFLFQSAIYRYINVHYIRNKYDNTNSNDIFDFMKMHFKEIKKIINKKYPNTKVVIFYYRKYNDEAAYIDKSRWKELEKEFGFIFIDSFDLTNEYFNGKKYELPNDPHPTEEAWNIIVPKLAERLKL